MKDDEYLRERLLITHFRYNYEQLTERCKSVYNRISDPDYKGLLELV